MKCESFQTGYSTLLRLLRGARVIFARHRVGGALRRKLRGNGPHVRDRITLLEARLLRGVGGLGPYCGGGAGRL